MSETVRSAVYRVARVCYDSLLRPVLPRKLGCYNGIVTRRPRLLDRTDTGDYEHAEVRGQERAISGGDDVVVIGGGFGITTIHASRLAGDGGSVLCIEAAASQCEIIEEAAEINHTKAPITVRQQLVGPARRVFGDCADAETVPIDELPDCDVLSLDIEGSEIEVLEGLQIRPREIVTECHDNETAVINQLNRLGYDDIGWGDNVVHASTSGADQ